MKPNAIVSFGESTTSDVETYLKFLSLYITAHIASDTKWTIGPNPVGFGYNIPVSSWYVLAGAIQAAITRMVHNVSDYTTLSVPMPAGLYPIVVGLASNYVRTESGYARFVYSIPASSSVSEEVNSSIFGPYGFFAKSGHKMITGTSYLLPSGKPRPSEGYTPSSRCTTSNYGVTVGEHLTDFYLASDDANDLSRTIAASLPPFRSESLSTVKGVVNMRKDLKFSCPNNESDEDIAPMIAALRAATLVLGCKGGAIPVCRRMTVTVPNSSMVIDYMRSEYSAIVNDDSMLIQALPPNPLSMDAIGLLQCAASASVDPMVFFTSLLNSSSDDMSTQAHFIPAMQFVRVSAEAAPYVDVPATFSESMVAHTTYLGRMADGKFMMNHAVNLSRGTTTRRAASDNTRAAYPRALAILATWFKSGNTYDPTDLAKMDWLNSEPNESDGYRIMLQLFGITKANSTANSSSLLTGMLASHDGTGLYNPVSILVYEHLSSVSMSDPTRPHGRLDYDPGSVSAGVSDNFAAKYADRLYELPIITSQLLVSFNPEHTSDGSTKSAGEIKAEIIAWSARLTKQNNNTSVIKTYLTGRDVKDHSVLEALVEQCRFPTIDLALMKLGDDLDPDLNATLPASVANVMNYTYLQSSTDPSFLIAAAGLLNPRTGVPRNSRGEMLKLAVESAGRFHILDRIKKVLKSPTAKGFINQLTTNVIPAMLSQVL